MTLERAKELLNECIKYIKYDNDSTSEHLHDIIGFTDNELVELEYGSYFVREPEEVDEDDE